MGSWTRCRQVTSSVRVLRLLIYKRRTISSLPTSWHCYQDQVEPFTWKHLDTAKHYKAIKVIGKTTVIIGENELKIQWTRFRLSKRKNFLRVKFFFFRQQRKYTGSHNHIEINFWLGTLLMLLNRPTPPLDSLSVPSFLDYRYKLKNRLHLPIANLSKLV